MKNALGKKKDKNCDCIWQGRFCELGTTGNNPGSSFLSSRKIHVLHQTLLRTIFGSFRYFTASQGSCCEEILSRIRNSDVGSFKVLPKFADLKQIGGDGSSYLYVELPDGRRVFGKLPFPQRGVDDRHIVNFMSAVLADVLDVQDRLDWRFVRCPRPRPYRFVFSPRSFSSSPSAYDDQGEIEHN